MSINITEKMERNGGFAEEVLAQSGENVRRCYQCGKCSAGCPVGFAMDYRPNRIIRMIQLGMKDEILNSKAIWLCASCSTCTTRCPRDVDLCKINDTLRVMAYKQGIKSKAKNEIRFHDTFMKSILKYGRVYELGIVMGLGIGSLLKDAELGLPMLTKGKLKFLPPKMKGANEIKKIAEAVKRLEAEK